MNKRRRCVRCKKMTERWMRINGSPWFCDDGCYSTTGIDHRTYDGQPAWKQSRINGRFHLGPWHIKRLLPDYKRYSR